VLPFFTDKCSIARYMLKVIRRTYSLRWCQQNVGELEFTIHEGFDILMELSVIILNEDGKANSLREALHEKGNKKTP
jgi:hypothetical protein